MEQFVVDVTVMFESLHTLREYSLGGNKQKKNENNGENPIYNSRQQETHSHSQLVQYGSLVRF